MTNHDYIKLDVDDVTPEQKLMLLCARLELSAAQRQELRESLKAGLDWDAVLLNARWHRLGGLLFNHLKDEGILDYVPDSLAQALKVDYLENAAKNALLRRELRQVIQVLKCDGIPVTVLKGAALLEDLYKNSGIRTMSDLDLLVPEELAERAQSIVMGLGYNPIGTSETQERTAENHRHLPSLISENGMAAVEIHSHIVTRDSPLRFSLAKFWTRARRTTIVGEEVLMFAPEDMLMHLAIHFFLDRRFRSYAALCQICDMAEVVRKYEHGFDWDRLVSEIHENKVQGTLYTALSLAKKLLDAPIPSEVLDRIRPVKFNDKYAKRFILRRVFDTRPVLASDLVTPLAGYSTFGLVKGVIGRLFPSRSYLSEHRGADVVEARGMYGSYFERLKEVFSILTQYLGNPSALWQQFQVDRWIHTLQEDSLSNVEKTKKA